MSFLSLRFYHYYDGCDDVRSACLQKRHKCVASVFLLVISKPFSGANDSSEFSPFKMVMYSLVICAPKPHQNGQKLQNIDTLNTYLVFLGVGPVLLVSPIILSCLPSSFR